VCTFFRKKFENFCVSSIYLCVHTSVCFTKLADQQQWLYSNIEVELIKFLHDLTTWHEECIQTLIHTHTHTHTRSWVKCRWREMVWKFALTSKIKNFCYCFALFVVNIYFSMRRSWIKIKNEIKLIARCWEKVFLFSHIHSLSHSLTRSFAQSLSWKTCFCWKIDTKNNNQHKFTHSLNEVGQKLSLSLLCGHRKHCAAGAEEKVRILSGERNEQIITIMKWANKIKKWDEDKNADEVHHVWSPHSPSIWKLSHTLIPCNELKLLSA
jgi:hypothetical protein